MRQIRVWQTPRRRSNRRWQALHCCAAAVVLVAALSNGRDSCGQATQHSSQRADSLWVAGLASSDVEAAWAIFEQAVATAPADPIILNAFRQEARARGRTARALAVLDTLLDQQPSLDQLEIQLALAHLDRLGDPVVDIAGAGVLVNRAIRRLDEVMERDPTAWLAAYAIGLSELVWHSKLRHARAAADHLERCLRDLELSGPQPTQVAQVSLLLGDAQIKARQYASARAIYEQGLRIDPQHAALQQRIALERVALLELTDTIYSLTQAPDTDLSLVIGQRPRLTGEE